MMEHNKLAERCLSNSNESVQCKSATIGNAAHLDGQSVLVPEGTTENDDRLHALYLSLDDGIQVLLSCSGEGKEVDGTEIFAHLEACSILRQEGSERLIDVFRKEWSEGSLNMEAI